MIQNFKSGKLTLDEEQKRVNFAQIKDKISAENAFLYYRVAEIFNLSNNIAKARFSYIERCFTAVFETRNFLEADFHFVRKILCSSELQITSELEVFHAADNWIKYKFEEREKFAEDLLLTVRLSLLSDATLSYLIRENFTICKINKCKAIVEKVMNHKDRSQTTRFCAQNQFDLYLCDGWVENTRYLKQINGKDLKSIKTASKFKHPMKFYDAVSLKDSIYIIYEGDQGLSVYKFAQGVDVLNYGNESNHRYGFCACALVDKIYIISGSRNYKLIDSCTQYDPMNSKYKELSGIKMARFFAACAVFQGKMVVSGGGVHNLRYETRENEVYDHVADAWTPMASLVNANSNHSLVPVKNKLFVVSNKQCEVYDGTADKFVVIKSYENLPRSSRFTTLRATCIGNKIVVFGRNLSAVAFYDTEKDEWYEEACSFHDTSNYALPKDNYFKYLGYMSCLKVPQLQYFMELN